jgi:hypothetical protein
MPLKYKGSLGIIIKNFTNKLENRRNEKFLDTDDLLKLNHVVMKDLDRSLIIRLNE